MPPGKWKVPAGEGLASIADEYQSLAVVDSPRQARNGLGLAQPTTRLLHALPQEITLIGLAPGGSDLERGVLRSRVSLCKYLFMFVDAQHHSRFRTTGRHEEHNVP